MDGTLTRGIHVFARIRQQIGLAGEEPILETLAKLPETEASLIRERLDKVELALAHQSIAAPGALELLTELRSRGYRLGVLTRNNRINIDATLEAAGLAEFFQPEDMISRSCAPHKPDPTGIHLLLKRWQGTVEQAVMLGDHKFDLLTGRAAGTLTVHIREGDAPQWPELSDVIIQSLGELLDSLPTPPDNEVNGV